jgi:hypothetical protein
VGVASAEGKRTERFPEKSLNLENPLNLRFGFPRVKRHFSYEGNEQNLCFSCLRLGLISHRRSLISTFELRSRIAF